jgi:hypothetical protein
VWERSEGSMLRGFESTQNKFQFDTYFSKDVQCMGFPRENMGASTSHIPMGLHGLLQGQLYH